MNLMLNNRAVMSWVMARTGSNAPPEFADPRVMEAAVAAVYQLLHQKDETGDAVRVAIFKAKQSI